MAANRSIGTHGLHCLCSIQVSSFKKWQMSGPFLENLKSVCVWVSVYKKREKDGGTKLETKKLRICSIFLPENPNSCLTNRILTVT